MLITVIQIDTSDSEALQQCRAIRHRVFTIGQGVPVAVEQDDNDSHAIHFLATVGDAPAATLRVRAVDTGTIKIERMAVLPEWQGKGIGRFIFQYVMRRYEGFTIILSAQLQASDFYQRMGFVPQGDTYQEGGIEHRKMVCAQACD